MYPLNDINMFAKTTPRQKTKQSHVYYVCYEAVMKHTQWKVFRQRGTSEL